MPAGVLIILLFLVALWGLVTRDNIIKKVMALSVLNSAVVILFVYGGARSGTTAPILEGGALDVVDPLPHELMLTAIVIGLCLTALALALSLRIYQRTGTLSARTLAQRKRRG
jgi:multicomponent Na+:H+ antiporter subunit C